MDTIDEEKIIVQSLSPDWFQNKVKAVSMLRLDLLHPIISGNKWYKLKHNLLYAKERGYETILTFGGAYSNHLIATASATHAHGLKSIGIIRGTYAENTFTQTLKECKQYGMQLELVSRGDYAKKKDEVFLKALSERFGDPYIVPEGGANDNGRKGAEEIAGLIAGDYTHICIAVGTGTTLIGLRNALPSDKMILGFAPMKNGKYLQEEITKHLATSANVNWQLFDEWHFGGFGRYNAALIRFMNTFFEVNHIPLDVVYTGKMMYGLQQLILSDYFPEAGQILCIHSGGLQGNSSIKRALVF